MSQIKQTEEWEKYRKLFIRRFKYANEYHCASILELATIAANECKKIVSTSFTDLLESELMKEEKEDKAFDLYGVRSRNIFRTQLRQWIEQRFMINTKSFLTVGGLPKGIMWSYDGRKPKRGVVEIVQKNSPPPTQTEERWEKEFDEKYVEDGRAVGSIGGRIIVPPKVKDFIRNLLSLAHTEGEKKGLKKVFKSVEKLKKHTSSEPDITNNPCGYQERIAYNTAINDALNVVLSFLEDYDKPNQ